MRKHAKKISKKPFFYTQTWPAIIGQNVKGGGTRRQNRNFWANFWIRFSFFEFFEKIENVFFVLKTQFLVHLKVYRLIHSRCTGWRHVASQNDEKCYFWRFYFMCSCWKMRKNKHTFAKLTFKIVYFIRFVWRALSSGALSYSDISGNIRVKSQVENVTSRHFFIFFIFFGRFWNRNLKIKR